MAEHGVAVPEQWAARPEAKKGVDRRWLGQLGGKELRGLVAEALRVNPNLRETASRVEQAAAEARIAGARRTPSLAGEFSGRRSEQKFVGFPFAGGGVPGALSSQFGVALNASWEVDLWGKLRAGHEASIADLQARQLESEAAQVSLAAQVAKAWFALAEANEQVTLAEEGFEARGLLARAVRERFEGAANADDGGSPSQVRATEAELARGAAQLAQRQQEKAHAVRQLELLLGRYPSGKLIAGARLPDFPSPTPVGLPSELLLRRPDVIAAERTFAAEGRRAKQAHLARFPSIRLTGSLGTTTDALEKILRSDYGVWSLGGSLTQPLFQGGELQAAESRALAVERGAAASLQRVVLQAFSEVEQALVAEQFLREREAFANRAAMLADEAARRAQEEFGGGTGDVLTLIDSHQRQIESASQLVAIRRMRLESRVDLHLALGGDFTL